MGSARDLAGAPMESQASASAALASAGRDKCHELVAYWHHVLPPSSAPEPGTRIGLTGAQGVGKTLLAGLLSQALAIPLLAEVSRSACGHGLPLGSATTLSAQAAMWFAQFDLESRHPSYVADRTLIDVVAHSTYVSGPGEQTADRLFVAALRNATAMAALAHYHLLVYVPVEFPMTADGLRDTDGAFQKFIDEAIRATLADIPVPYIRVSGTPEQRLREALRAVAKARPGDDQPVTTEV